jgi:hypothetical protein
MILITKVPPNERYDDDDDDDGSSKDRGSYSVDRCQFSTSLLIIDRHLLDELVLLEAPYRQKARDVKRQPNSK